MATTVVVNGVPQIRPGVYGQIKSGIVNPPQSSGYGNVLLIDTGEGAGYGGGIGIVGTSKQGQDTVYTFATMQAMQTFVKGGALWNLAQALFKPSKKTGVVGSSNVFYVRAAATVPGTISATIATQAIVLTSIEEGIIVNSVIDGTSSLLAKGYACRLINSSTTPGKYVFQLFLGTYKGPDTLNNNVAYDGIASSQAKPSLIAQSPVLTTVGDLLTWMRTDFTFSSFFTVTSPSTTPSTPLSGADLTTGYLACTGGTETYSEAHVTDVLNAIAPFDIDFILTTDYAANSFSTGNQAVQNYISTAKNSPIQIIGGGYDASAFDVGSASSVVVAQDYNTESATIVHGGGLKAGILSTGKLGLLNKTSLYKAALVTGRLAGLPPQTPGTFKDLDLDGEIHKLTNAQLEECLRFGVTATYMDTDFNRIVIQQAVNTLQNNTFLINADASSFAVEVVRVKHQINKEITKNAKNTFFSGEQGPNRNTVSSESVQAFIVSYLTSVQATSTKDNYITSFDKSSIVVTTDQDNVFANYGFVPNTPVNKLILTGTMLSS